MSVNSRADRHPIRAYLDEPLNSGITEKTATAAVLPKAGLCAEEGRIGIDNSSLSLIRSSAKSL